MLLLSTPSIDPCLWGESDQPAVGPSASFSVHLASSAFTPAGFVLPSTLCTYDLWKGDLFVLSWARVRRVRRGSLSSELLICGGGVRSILLLPLVARCLETIDVCIWRMFIFM